MFFDESIILQKKYYCPVCMVSGFTFDKPEMSKTRGSIANYNSMSADMGTGHSYPEQLHYYDIQCYGCGFNFRVAVR
jgi:hypothetical protein